MMFVGAASNNFGFNARKAGQIAAFFVLREGMLLNVVKLIKLVYLANRLFMEHYDEPILVDGPVSMRLGPVNSQTYECVNSGAPGWDEFISDRANHDVALASPELSQADLDELSEAEVDVLDDIWQKFGHMDQWQLVAYTHRYCLEWEDPGNSSTPIPYARIFKFLGKENPTGLEENLLEYNGINRMLSRMR